MELMVLYQEPKGEDLDCHSSWLDEGDFMAPLKSLFDLIHGCKRRIRVVRIGR